jgi:hypothetical protein
MTASADPGEVRIEAFRQIIARGQLAWIEGRPVDLFSAAHVVGLHDTLAPAAREIYRKMPVERMVDLAFDSLRHELRTRTRRR